MNRAFSLAIFASAFAVAYIVSFVNGWTWFRYYPLIGEVTTGTLPRSAGPAMNWYSWIVQGLAIGTGAGLVAAIVPKALTERIWSAFAWLVPAAVVAFTFYFEWHWLQGK